MALHETFRTHTVNVERAGRVSDGAGGWTETFAVVGVLTGSLQPTKVVDVERSSADQERADLRFAFYCDPGADIARGDELVVTAVRQVDGSSMPVADDRRFRVLSVGDWAAASAIDHLAVNLEEVQTARES